MTAIAIRDTNLVVRDYKDLFSKINREYPDVKLTGSEITNLTSLVPEPETSFRYTLIGINTELANAWRRIMLDEIVYPQFACTMSDISSTDDFVQRTTDYIANRINLIPISYIPQDTKIEHFTIHVRNSTPPDRHLRTDVTSADIKWSGTGTCPIRWDQKIAITELLPGREIRIKITIEWGVGLKSGTYSKFGPLLYRPIEYKEPFPSSYTVHPTAFELGVTCCSLIDPKWANILGWRTLSNKLNSCITRLQELKGGPPHITPHLDISMVEGEKIRYRFIAETLSLVNVLAWYCYKVDPTIPYVNAGDEHLEDPYRTLHIIHPEYHQLIITAARLALKDIDTIIGLFVM
jgi:hypothetical protein